MLLLLSCFSCAQLHATLGTEACPTPLCMGFSRQEYWSGLHALLQVIGLIDNHKNFFPKGSLTENNKESCKIFFLLFFFKLEDNCFTMLC